MGLFISFLGGFFQTPAMVGVMGTPPPPPDPINWYWISGLVVGAAALSLFLTSL